MRQTLIFVTWQDFLNVLHCMRCETKWSNRRWLIPVNRFSEQHGMVKSYGKQTNRPYYDGHFACSTHLGEHLMFSLNLLKILMISRYTAYIGIAYMILIFLCVVFIWLITLVPMPSAFVYGHDVIKPDIKICMYNLQYLEMSFMQNRLL